VAASALAEPSREPFNMGHQGSAQADAETQLIGRKPFSILIFLRLRFLVVVPFRGKAGLSNGGAGVNLTSMVA